ncbi:MAG TPA: hypothetical protein VFF69_11955 [Phycisphaerales bacterium]|nr:hypothetical protein [Phycisphaerales bacterium]
MIGGLPGVGALGSAIASAPRTRAFPVTDWQFWVVTGIAISAAAWIVYKLFPRRALGKRRSGPAKRATLTVAGRPVEPARRGADCH